MPSTMPILRLPRPITPAPRPTASTMKPRTQLKITLRTQTRVPRSHPIAIDVRVLRHAQPTPIRPCIRECFYAVLLNRILHLAAHPLLVVCDLEGPLPAETGDVVG